MAPSAGPLPTFPTCMGPRGDHLSRLSHGQTRYLACRGARGAAAAHQTRLDGDTSLPVSERPRRPEWMKVRAPSADSRYYDVRKLIHGAGLNTICEEARCPNIAECWGRGTTTSRSSATPAPAPAATATSIPDGPRPARSAGAVPARADGGADEARPRRRHVRRPRRPSRPRRGALRGHDRALRAKVPSASVEVLTPEFLDCEEEALSTVLAERPDVFNHNIETVRRLHPNMRGAKAGTTRPSGCCAERRRSRPTLSLRTPC